MNAPGLSACSDSSKNRSIVPRGLFASGFIAQAGIDDRASKPDRNGRQPGACQKTGSGTTGSRNSRRTLRWRRIARLRRAILSGAADIGFGHRARTFSAPTGVSLMTIDRTHDPANLPRHNSGVLGLGGGISLRAATSYSCGA